MSILSWRDCFISCYHIKILIFSCERINLLWMGSAGHIAVFMLVSFTCTGESFWTLSLLLHLFVYVLFLSHPCVMFFLPILADCGGTLVLVSQDGIQRPPLHFPPGGHLLAFLSCLETGLLPRGQLEPPLWSQKGKVCCPVHIQKARIQIIKTQTNLWIHFSVWFRLQPGAEFISGDIRYHTPWTDQ